MSTASRQMQDALRQASCIRVLAASRGISEADAAIIWVTEGHATAYRDCFPQW